MPKKSYMKKKAYRLNAANQMKKGLVSNAQGTFVPANQARISDSLAYMVHAGATHSR